MSNAAFKKSILVTYWAWNGINIEITTLRIPRNNPGSRDNLHRPDFRLYFENVSTLSMSTNIVGVP